jgi:hypothetical protein
MIVDHQYSKLVKTAYRFTLEDIRSALYLYYKLRPTAFACDLDLYEDTQDEHGTVAIMTVTYQNEDAEAK